MTDIERPWLKFYDHKQTPDTLTYPDISLYESVRLVAARFPERIALVFMDRETRYKEFIEKVDHIAACLYNMGVRKGDRALICMPNCPQAVCFFYAVVKCGAIATVIHPLSAKNEIKGYLNNSKAKVALTLDAFCGNFIEVKDETKLETLIVTSIKDELSFVKKIGYSLTLGRKVPKMPVSDCILMWRDFLRKAEGMNMPDVPNKGNDPAVILYSGGTTGTSKGVLLSNLNFNSTSMETLACSNCIPCDIQMLYTDEAKKYIKKEYIVLSVMPIFHGFGLCTGIHTFLSFGGRCILVPTFTPDTYAKLIATEKPNFIAGVPTLYEKMISSDAIKDADLSCLEGVFVGGDALPSSTREKVDKFIADHNGKTIIREGYGLTECVTATCLTPINGYRPGSIGIPFPDVLFKIVRIGTTENLPYGEEGEICISGPNVMLGYVDNPEETASTLKVHADGRTWLHTGDLGMMDSDGFVYFKQRYKRMIISSGYNIYPCQIEDVLNSFPGIETSCAIGIPDPVRQQRVKAFIVLKDGVQRTDELMSEIKAYCKDNIARFALPKEYEVIDKMPMTKIGKIAYTELEELERRRRETEYS
jgi:long-chain acyl-CoA synthetase